MEKTNFNITFSDEKTKEMQKQTNQLIATLKKDLQIRALIKRGNIDESCIERYPWKLNTWLRDYQPCVGCHGLNACKQKTQGYYASVNYDGLLQRSETACKYMRSKLAAEEHMTNYLVCDLPEKMRNISLLDLNIAKESQAYAKVVTKLLQYNEKNQGVFLYGNMGTGKTYLAAGICNDHAKNGEKVAFIHYPSLCTRLVSQIKGNEFRSELERLRAAKFLVIDDIGAESLTEWNRDSILLPLLNARYDANLPTWFTSNCDLVSLKVHMTFSSRGSEDQLKAERICERIEAMCKIQTLTGKDRRK